MIDIAADNVLRLTILADKSSGEDRIRRYHPETGDAYLADPATWDVSDPSTWQHKPWPFLGLQIDNKPVACRIPASTAYKGMAEGWLTLDGSELVHRPGGPANDPWRQTHTFTHAKSLTLHSTEGDVVYKIVHQPDKYADADGATDETPVTPEHYAAGETRVDWFYDLELVNS